MKSTPITALLLFLLPCIALSQILPKDFSKLNYRIIGFQFPANTKGYKYKLDIALGDYDDDNSFKKNIIKSLSSDSNRIIAEVPSFGQQYTWRVTYVSNNGGQTKENRLYHFATLIIPNVDTSINRLRVVNYSPAYKNAFVFLDGTFTLYDTKGKPVWYLPNTDGILNESSQIRDIRLTPNHTITFIAGDTHVGQKIYEINYAGDILWRGPNNGIVSGDSIENYHHEFTQLTNGNFMALGSEYIPCSIPSSMDSSVIFYYNENKQASLHPNKLPFGTLIEYDKKGNVVWSWKCSSYFSGSDIAYRKRADAITNMDVHDNGFYFDQKDSVIYLSFRNISRVVKVKYPEGKVLNAYGEIYNPDGKTVPNNLFCGQHSSRLSNQGYLYLFNNNSCNQPALPKIVMMQEPTPLKATLKSVWEYECTLDGNNDPSQKEYDFSANGNVVELPNNDLFASMSSPQFSKVFIVNLGKQILWSAVPEKWMPDEKKWAPILQYRASIISSRKDLEDLIWNSEIQ